MTFEVGKTYKNLLKEAGTYVERKPTKRLIYISKTITIIKYAGELMMTHPSTSVYLCVNDKGTKFLVDDDDIDQYELV